MESRDMENQKTNQKPSFMYQQAAAIPFLYEKDKLYIVLVTNKKKTKWTLPKGIIEYNSTACETAVNEAFEEAGVEGVVYPYPIGSFHYKKWGGTLNVQVFPLFVTHLMCVWDEMSDRKRKKIALTKAVHIVKPEQKDILKAFAAMDIRKLFVPQP